MGRAEYGVQFRARLALGPAPHLPSQREKLSPQDLGHRLNQGDEFPMNLCPKSGALGAQCVVVPCVG